MKAELVKAVIVDLYKKGGGKETNLEKSKQKSGNQMIVYL